MKTTNKNIFFLFLLVVTISFSSSLATEAQAQFNIFVSITPLVFTIIFFFLGYLNFKIGDKEENGVLSFFFYGLGFVFLVAHLLITNLVIQNFTDDVPAVVINAHTDMMIGFFILVGFMVGFMLFRVALKQLDNFYKRSGLR